MKCNNCDKEMVSYCSKDLEYFFSKINWGSSFLDADAVKIVNGEKGVVCSNKKSYRMVK